MRQKIFTLALSLLIVLGLNAQKANNNYANGKANSAFGINQLTKKDTPVKKYVYTGGDSHQSKYAEKVDLFVDDFEGGNLDNFTVINGGDPNGFVWVAEGGNVGPAIAMLKYHADEAHDDWLITPQIAVSEATKLTFYGKNRSAGTFAEDFDIVVSKTGNEVADFTETIAADVTPGAEWTYYEYDLTAFAGQSIYIGLHNTTLNMWELYLDGFKIFTPDPKDLAVESISAVPYTLPAFTAFTPKVIVKNAGSAAQNSYDVVYTITNTETDVAVYDNTVNVTDEIAIGATAEIAFPSVVLAVGNYSIKAKVVLTDDQNNTNDELTNEYTITVADLEGMAYSYLLYDGDDEEPGIFAFDPEAPETAYRISKSDGATPSIWAGDVVDGVWYAVNGGPAGTLVKLYNIDFVTGDMTEIVEVGSNIQIASMAYDYTTEKMFICYGMSNGASLDVKLGTLNLTNGEITEVGNISSGDPVIYLYGLACNLDGNLYGIASDKNVYSIDKTNAAKTSLGTMNITENPVYIQTAAFNHATGKLYWLGLTENTQHNYEVSLTDGSLTDLGERSLNEYTSMVYKYYLTKYNVSFKVTDGANDIEGAEIVIKGKTYTTDANGEVVVPLPAREYEYIVRKSGYTNAEGGFTVEDQDITIDVAMTAGDAKWPVNFTVNNDLGAAVEGATITIDGETLTTDDKGMASTEHVNATDLAFTVEASLHDTYNGTVTIADAAVDVDPIKLQRTKHNLNFTVKKSWGSNEVVANANIKVVLGDSTYNAVTDATGMATFNILEGNGYTYDVSAEGFVVANGTVDLTEDKDIEVMLDEAKSDPYALMVEVDGTNANFSWNNATGFFDGFETYDDFVLEFSPWTLRDEDGLATYSFQNLPFTHSGEPMAGIIFNPAAVSDQLDPAHTGDKYVATFNPLDASACNDWIISPKISVIAGDKVSFFARGGHPNYSEEKFQVFISETDTEIASFTNISDVVTCPAGSVEWVEYSYDIPATYADKEIYVALHVTSVDQFYFCLDDFKVGNPSKIGSRTLQSYTVQLNGVEKATGITETNYQFTDLEVGTYTAGVKAIYESGESSFSTKDFEIEAPVTGVTLTFNVDMSAPIEAGEFTVGTDKVYVSGNFGGYDWPEPGSEAALELTDSDGDKVYTLEVTNVEAGNYEYKYFKNAGWSGGEWDGGDNRKITVADEAVTVNDVWGVSAVNTLEAEVMIAPNPTNSYFIVKVNGHYTLEVVDITGRVIEKTQMDNTATIDLSARNVGMYFVRITGNEGNATFKVIKK